MSDENDRRTQEELLETNRRRLAYLRKQEATLGVSAPFALAEDIRVCRVHIEKIKMTLRNLGYTVVDRLGDMDDPKATLHPIMETNQEETATARVFFVLCTFCSDTLKKLILKQNQKQSMFDIGIANGWKYWGGRSNAEIELKSLYTNSRLEFCERFQGCMTKYNQEFDRSNFDGISIAITELPFPKNFYTWNTRDRKCVVIGINSLEHLFQTDPIIVNKIIVRVIQRMLVFSLEIATLEAHEDTRGCLFDLTRELKDIQYSVDDIHICKGCKEIISREKGSQFLSEINEWIINTFD